MYDLKIMSVAAYHGHTFSVEPHLSQSMAKILIEDCPARAFHYHPCLGGKQKKSTRPMDDGTIVHDLLLNGGRLEGIKILDYANYNTKAAQQDRDLTIAAGIIPVLADKFFKLEKAAEAIKNRLADFEDGIYFDKQTEGVVFWTETANDGTEVKCKSRIDHWPVPQIDDLKTCDSAHPDDLHRAIKNLEYRMQAAVYPRALEKAFPDLAGEVQFRWIFAELTDPYLINVVEPDDRILAIGKSKWNRAVNLWAKCLNSKRWPGYVEGVHTATASDWDLTTEAELSANPADLMRHLDTELTLP